MKKLLAVDASVTESLTDAPVTGKTLNTLTKPPKRTRRRVKRRKWLWMILILNFATRLFWNRITDIRTIRQRWSPIFSNSVMQSTWKRWYFGWCTFCPTRCTFCCCNRSFWSWFWDGTCCYGRDRWIRISWIEHSGRALRSKSRFHLFRQHFIWIISYYTQSDVPRRCKVANKCWASTIRTRYIPLEQMRLFLTLKLNPIKQLTTQFLKQLCRLQVNPQLFHLHCKTLIKC